MTGQRVLPNLGLTDKWTVGTSGWGPGMDANLTMLDTLLFLTVLSASTDVAAITGTPNQGDRYLVPAGATAAWAGMDNKLAVFIDGAWMFLTPKLGWRAAVVDASYEAKFNGAQWLPSMQPYDVQLWRFKLPWNPQEPLVSIMLPRPVLFPLGFANSRASCKVAPVTAQTLPVFKNGTQVGSVAFAAGATTGTFNLASTVQYATGDVFEVYPSAATDPAFGGLRIVFAGNR